MIVNNAGCAVIESITIIDIVTGIEDALIEEIDYRLEGSNLTISIPDAIKNKLQGWQVFNANGSLIHKSKSELANKSEILIPNIPKNQLVLINLIFSDDRIVKKLIFVD